MASYSGNNNHHQTLIYILLIILLLHINTSLFEYNNKYIISACNAKKSDHYYQKVDLTLYYETLCPYCSYFIAHNLVRLFTDQIISIVNLRLVPWGNAAVQSSGYFQCQHGSGECLLNMVEACAIDVYPDTYKHFFFIQCIESLAYQNREAEWQSCFEQLSLESKPIFDCYNHGNATKIELRYAHETSQLNPPHAYVPWVLVNDQPLHEDYHNFASYICKAYKGTSVPAACRSSEPMIKSFSNEATDKTEHACYIGSHHNLTSFVPSEILQQNREVFT